MYQRDCKILKEKSFLLLGARGTGKTWLLESEFRHSSILWINLLESRAFLKYQTNPALLRQELELYNKDISEIGSQNAPWVIIDEIQRVPQLLNEVHSILEDRSWGRRFRFGLSGSSARKLKRGGANLLAGRALLNHLFPLSAKEVGDPFDLDDALSWGLLPIVQSESSQILRSEFLESYVAVYLREEIREEQIVRNLDPFSRFLEVAAQSSGQIVSYSKIGRDCQVDSRAVARYFQILEETLLGTFLPPYHKSVRKQQRESPKFYFFDTGVMRTLERTISLPVRPQSYGYGRLFEHFFIWEVIKHNEYLRKRYKLYYLLTKDGAEIDLIIERPGKTTVLIECKSGTNPQLADARHLLSLMNDFENCELWVVSQTEQDRKERNVYFLNWKNSIQKLFWNS